MGKSLRDIARANREREYGETAPSERADQVWEERDKHEKERDNPKSA